MDHPPPPQPKFAVNDRVRFPRFGPGSVVSISGPIFCPPIDEWLSAVYTIAFDCRRFQPVLCGFAEDSLRWDFGFEPTERRAP